MVAIQSGAACEQVISRSVRRMPLLGSMCRESVSTAMTCGADLFQGQYLRQFCVETSSQE